MWRMTAAGARFSVRRILAAAIGVVAVAYLGAVGYLVASETSIVFETGGALGPLRPGPPIQQIESRRDDGSRQVTWVMPAAQDADGAPWVIFLHGNGSSISSRLNILHYERLRQLGLNVIAPEYRGYAGTGGVPSEAGVEADGRSAYDYLTRQRGIAPSRIVLFGWSLGSAVAVDIASKVPEAAVVLEGAMASVADVGQERYPYIPVKLLIRNPFESILKIGRVHAPLLFLHSPEDTVVSIEEGRRLFAAAPPPKQFIEVRGGHVYAAERDPGFFGVVRGFLEAQGVLRAVGGRQ
jgi:fermentation-respiration switch protein FrsA (DUF1100 family)